MAEQSSEERGFWIRRTEATGKAQARYLWFVLIACLFYAALRTGNSGGNIEVPVVLLRLDAEIVLASGGPVIAFLVLAVLGAIRAWSNAIEKVRGQRPAKDVEQLDAYPNAIDLAIYTTPRSPEVVQHLLSFAYPLYLAAGLAESAWLALSAAADIDRLAPRLAFHVLQWALWLPAVILLFGMVRNRVWQLLRRPIVG